ncbi:MAG: flagellar motor protein MotB [Terracidiphilus sp.]
MSRHPNRRRPSQDRWLVSYADFITLLFAFFVVLYSASKADQKKQAQVSSSINAAFRVLGFFGNSNGSPGNTGDASATDQPVLLPNIVVGEHVLSPSKVQEDLGQIRREMEQLLSNQIAKNTVSVQMGRDGLIISLREAGFFNSGSATPRPETLPTIRLIAVALGRTPYDLRIEGHTDNIPIHTAEFDSNWELSSARATRIARLFLDLKAIHPERISAAGYAEFHPVASNDTAEGRAQNRRVDLVVLPRTRIDLTVTNALLATGPWRKITDDN